MNKKFSKLLGMLLALALVFTAIPVSFAAPKEDPADPKGNSVTVAEDEKVTFNFTITANGLNYFQWKKLSVKFPFDFHWEAMTDKGVKLHSENMAFDNLDNERTKAFAMPANNEVEMKTDEVGATAKKYDLSKLKDVQFVLTLKKEAVINDPDIDVAVDGQNLDGETSQYEMKFPVVFKDGKLVQFGEDKEAPFTVDVVKDFELTYKMPGLDSLKLTLRDPETKKGVSGKTIKAFPVMTKDGAYLTDENGDYIVDENESMKLTDNNALGGNSSSRWPKTNALGEYEVSANAIGSIIGGLSALKNYPKPEAGNGTVIAFAAFEDGNRVSEYSFVTIKTPYGGKPTYNTHFVELWLTPDANSVTFKILVRELYGEKPVQAGEGYTITYMQNTAKHEEAPNWQPTKFTAVTDKNGYVELKVPKDQLKLTHEMMSAYNTSGNVAKILKYVVEGGLQATSKTGEKSEIKSLSKLEAKDNKVIFDFVVTGPYKLHRIAGENRFETAVQIAKRTFPNGLQSKVVILAESEDGADALAASGLAHILQAPILLTGRGSKTLNNSTYEYLKQLKKDGQLKYVVVLGGTNAIPGEIDEFLQADSKLKLKTSRIYGENRFETAVDIASFMHKEGKIWTSVSNAMKAADVDIDKFGEVKSDEVLLANGWRFADGVIASVPAAKFGTPILLTDADHLTGVTKDWIDKKASTEENFKTFVLGGTAVVSSTTFGQIQGEKARLAGENRYATNWKVNEKFFARATKLFIATGTALPDSLVSGMLVANDNAALMLVGPNGLTDAQKKYLKESTSYSSVEILGGFNAVSAAVEDQIIEIMASR